MQLPRQLLKSGRTVAGQEQKFLCWQKLMLMLLLLETGSRESYRPEKSLLRYRGSLSGDCYCFKAKFCCSKILKHWSGDRCRILTTVKLIENKILCHQNFMVLPKPSHNVLNSPLQNKNFWPKGKFEPKRRRSDPTTSGLMSSTETLLPLPNKSLQI